MSDVSNKSLRNLNQQFDIKNFNSVFQELRAKMEKGFTDKLNYDENDDDMIENVPIHKKSIEYVIINIRELFYNCLEMLTMKQNPLPYIFSTQDRQFSFSLFLIIIGTLLLLFSNLMRSPRKLN